VRQSKIPDESIWGMKAIEYYVSGHSKRETLNYLNESVCFVSDAALRKLFSKHNIHRNQSDTARMRIEKGFQRYSRKCGICCNDFSARTPTAVMCDTCTNDDTSGFTKTKQQKYGYYRRIISYGISVQEYEKMLEVQDNKCGLCQKKLKSVCIDHSHSTGNIRGLLCHQCNLLLGQIELLGSSQWLKRTEIWIQKDKS